MSDDLPDLLGPMKDSPVPPLAAAQRVRDRGEQRRHRRRAVLAGAGAVLVLGAGGTAYGLAAGGGTSERLQVAAPASPSPTAAPPASEACGAGSAEGCEDALPPATPAPCDDVAGSPGTCPEPALPEPTQPDPGAPTVEPSDPTPVTVDPTPVTPPPTPAAPAPTPNGVAPAPTFPPAAAVEHGGRYWAVYLAVTRDDAGAEGERRAALAREQATEAGYGQALGGGDVGCDQGAREALRLDPARGYLTLSIFFDTEAQARAFVDAYEPGVVGVAQITAYCLD